MLPGVSPGAVVQRVANVIMGDIVGSFCAARIGNILGQQIAPVGVAIGIGYSAGRRARFRCCGIAVFLPAGDVAGVVIAPRPGLVCRLVVLTDQLVGRVVDVGGGVAAYRYCENISVVIVGMVAL